MTQLDTALCTEKLIPRCRSFRMKTLQERKTILKEHKRSFKCCSPSHLAKDCQATLKCSECDSERHCSAMHPDTSLPSYPLPTPQRDTATHTQFPTRSDVTMHQSLRQGQPPTLLLKGVPGARLPPGSARALHQDVRHTRRSE